MLRLIEFYRKRAVRNIHFYSPRPRWIPTDLPSQRRYSYHTQHFFTVILNNDEVDQNVRPTSRANASFNVLLLFSSRVPTNVHSVSYPLQESDPTKTNT